MTLWDRLDQVRADLLEALRGEDWTYASDARERLDAIMADVSAVTP